MAATEWLKFIPETQIMLRYFESPTCHQKIKIIFRYHLDWKHLRLVMFQFVSVYNIHSAA